MKAYAKVSPWTRLPPKGWRVPIGVYASMWFQVSGLRLIRVGG